MKTIEIDSDVYNHLLQNSTEFGESPSSVLRRLLKLNPTGLFINAVPKSPSSDLEKHLNSEDFKYSKGVVGGFLSVLGWLYRKHQPDFSKVENIKGRGRIYFAQDAQTLHRSGRSVNPKQIPGSSYWVITTTPTDLKQEILSNVFKVLGYDSTDIRKAVTAIAE